MKVRELRRYLRRCRGNQDIAIAVQNLPGMGLDFNVSLQPVRLMVNEGGDGLVVISGSDDRKGLLGELDRLNSGHSSHGKLN